MSTWWCLGCLARLNAYLGRGSGSGVEAKVIDTAVRAVSGEVDASRYMRLDLNLLLSWTTPSNNMKAVVTMSGICPATVLRSVLVEFVVHSYSPSSGVDVL